ncbi:MAG: hypothetical protein MK081_01810 [Flavobacteriales bacterium]|nr:hypothetical protein [Flavobacteriales bacterium]
MNRLLLLFLVLAPLWGTAQSVLKNKNDKTPIEILNSDRVLYDEEIAKADRLIGNVRLKYKEAIMKCDSAYRYPNGDFEAFSTVRINQGDSLRLNGDRLYITNEDKQAKLRDRISLRDKDLTLTTEILDYDLETGVASYFGGGRIVSSENQNVLTSEQGFYDSESEFFHFRDSVVLKNREYTVLSDTLRYSGQTETAFFFGPTEIKSDNNTIYCSRGWYNTVSGVCQFTNRAEIWSKNTYLAGDSVYYEAERGFGEVFGGVVIQDTTSNYLIQGEYGWHNEENDRSLVTDRAQMIQFFDTDSLFLHADTLRAEPDSLGERLITAYEHVKFFKSDLQGKADSLTYAEEDSLLTLLGSPVLWSDANQISGELIDIKIFSGKIQQMDIYDAALIISEAAPESFNQIKGRNLTGYFKDNQLSQIHVKGNGQTIYFPVEEGEEKKAVGVNKAECSDVIIYVEGTEIQRIALIKKPSGAMHPLSKAADADRFLEGFFWDTMNRPLTREEIFSWIEEESE